MAGQFSRIFHQKGQYSSRPSGFVHCARYAAVSSLQRHPVCAANDTLIAGKMDKIKTIRTFRSGSQTDSLLRGDNLDARETFKDWLLSCAG